jgi:hypothetical protein
MKKEKKKPLRYMSIPELYGEAEKLKSEIYAGHHVIRNQFKLLNIRDHIRRKRGGGR